MKIKKILILVLFILTVIITPNISNADVDDSFTIDGITYKVLTENTDNYTVEVSKYEGDLTSVTIPKTVTNGENTYTITSIGEIAFMNNELLTNVTIPNSVTTIGNNAFRGCKVLSNVEIPNSVTTIGEGAFLLCKGLKNINLPSSITTIGSAAFHNCHTLESIVIPDGVKTIGTATFFECFKLENIEIPNSVTSIGGSAFIRCTSLKSIEIPDSVTTIGNSAFVECTALESIKIPELVTEINNSVFYGCTSLTSVTIPPSVISIDDTAFDNCNDFIIYGGEGSIAEEYANAKNISFKNIYYSVKYSLTNLTTTGKEYVESGLDYITTLSSDDGYKLPKNITVKIDGIDLSTNDYEYDYEKGKLKIDASKIDGNIEIEAIGEKIYKISFDANGGEFSNGNTYLTFDDVEECDFNNLSIPTRSDYKFIGYYTEKTEGTSLDDIMNSEAGIEKDMVFYAQWELAPKDTTEDTQIDNNKDENTGNTSTEDNKDESAEGTSSDNKNNTNTNNETSNNNISSGANPQTGDNLMAYVVILAISSIGMAFTIIDRENKK